MRPLLPLVVLLVALPAQAQFPIPVVGPDAAAQALAHAPNGSVFAMGTFRDSVALEPQQPLATLVWEAPNPTGYLARFGADGVLQWAHALEARRAGFNDESSATAKRIAALPDGGVLLLGVIGPFLLIDLDPGPGEAIVQPPATDPVAFVVRYDAAGAYVWHKAVPMTGAVSAANRLGLATDGDGVYLLIPPSPDADPGPTTTPLSTPGLVALSLSDGATRYAVEATPPGTSMIPDDLAAGAGSVYVLGYSGNLASTRFNLSRRTAIDGALSWSFVPTAGADRMTEAEVDADGVLYVAGPLSSSATGVALDPTAPGTLTWSRSGNGRTFLASYSPSGALRWSARIANNIDSFGGGFAVEGGEAFVAGSTTLGVHSTTDGSLLRSLPTAYGTPRLGAVAATGSHVTVYSTQGFQGLPAGAPPTVVVALNRSDLTLASTTVASEGAASRDGLALGVPMPHPVSGRAAVRVTMAAAGDALVTLSDVLGRRVALLADGPLAEGDHLLTLDASGLAAGVYVLVLDAGGRRQTQTVVVAR